MNVKVLNIEQHKGDFNHEIFKHKKIIIGTIASATILMGGTALASTSSKTGATVQVTSNQEQQIKQIVNLAGQGKVVTGKFSLGSTSNEIIKKWGKPSEQNSGYLNYEKRSTVFGLDEKKQIVNSITTEDKKLNTISLKAVKSTLGKPVVEYLTDGDHEQMVVYETKGTKITFSFEYTNHGNPTLIGYYIVNTQ